MKKLTSMPPVFSTIFNQVSDLNDSMPNEIDTSILQQQIEHKYLKVGWKSE
jgi:hypothetical protein